MYKPMYAFKISAMIIGVYVLPWITSNTLAPRIVGSMQADMVAAICVLSSIIAALAVVGYIACILIAAWNRKYKLAAFTLICTVLAVTSWVARPAAFAIRPVIASTMNMKINRFPSVIEKLKADASSCMVMDGDISRRNIDPDTLNELRTAAECIIPCQTARIGLARYSKWKQSVMEIAWRAYAFEYGLILCSECAEAGNGISHTAFYQTDFDRVYIFVRTRQ